MKAAVAPMATARRLKALMFGSSEGKANIGL
jgi:hypothetical protein